MSLPPVNLVQYNKQKLGYFGELGTGAHARIRFLQCAVTEEELDNITLIENIQGSEQWDIRDLFQRDVDMARVEQSILPYLTDPEKVKFFNPLTLVLLPVTNGKVNADIKFVESKSIKKEGHDYFQYEREALFLFEVHKTYAAYSSLSWNTNSVKLVAIDGQHRLSALKFWKNTQGPKDLDTWQIPVVILGIFKADNDPNHKPANLLEIVRKTFIYINSRAEEVNEARRILLDDEQIEAVCTQEFVQASHANDCKSDQLIDPKKLPLLFFDWRGQVKWRKDEGDGAPVVALGSVLRIEEIYDWLRVYVFDDQARIVLQLEDLAPPLSESFQDRDVLTHEDTLRVRTQFMAVVYPGLSHLLEQFEPLRIYVEKIRSFEKRERDRSEAASYVFQKLRFGSHPELLGQMKALVDSTYASVVEQLQKMRQNSFDYMIERDIGMRAIVYAFGALKISRDDFAKRTGDWKEHAEWFVPKLNEVYKAGWFRAYADLSKEQSKVLTHICFDTAGAVINYKLDDVPRALGSLLALLVIREARTKFKSEQKAELWDKYGDALEPTLRKGFRKEQRAILKPTFQGTQQDFIAEVNKKADKNVTARLKLIQEDIIRLAGS